LNNQELAESVVRAWLNLEDWQKIPYYFYSLVDQIVLQLDQKDSA